MNTLGDRDHELIRRDTALGGLSLLLDAGQLRRKLSHQIDTSKLGDFKLTYLRYKPGMSCLGRYEFQLAGKTHLAYAKTFCTDSTPKLDKAREVPKFHGPLGPGRLTVQESNLFISFFPHDLRLRSIARLAEPVARGRLLGRIFDDDLEWEGCEESVLNYKPERRLVVRLVHPKGPAATVKFYTQHEFSRITRLGKPELDSTGLRLPIRIGNSKKHCASAFDWIAGDTLRSYGQDCITVGTHFRNAGQLIARYHASSVIGLSPGDQLLHAQALQSQARQLTFLLPELHDTAEKLADGLQFVPTATAFELRPVHGDFYDKQVIVGSDGLSLIDLDQTHLGNTIEDLGCFIAHQERLALKNQGASGEQISRLSNAFLDGYVEAGGQFHEQQLAGWTALYLFRLSLHPFRDRAMDWPGQTHAILRRVGELLRASQQRLHKAAG